MTKKQKYGNISNKKGDDTMMYSIGKFAKEIGVNVQTLRNWHNSEVVNNEQLSPQQELVQDLISIIHVFSCRIYGLRKYKKEIEADNDAKSL